MLNLSLEVGASEEDYKSSMKWGRKRNVNEEAKGQNVL